MTAPSPQVTPEKLVTREQLPMVELIALVINFKKGLILAGRGTTIVLGNFVLPPGLFNTRDYKVTHAFHTPHEKRKRHTALFYLHKSRME
jgi:hypothetical protein